MVLEHNEPVDRETGASAGDAGEFGIGNQAQYGDSDIAIEKASKWRPQMIPGTSEDGNIATVSRQLDLDVVGFESVLDVDLPSAWISWPVSNISWSLSYCQHYWYSGPKAPMKYY
ncbi:hypothetical protein ACEPPN_005662 [Leptodophora sp. 'Broadleaf-Isolate-01']